jgi:ParB family chromosome partitioning protein
MREHYPATQPAYAHVSQISGVQLISLDQLLPTGKGRQSINRNKIIRKAEFIRKYGVEEPLTVRKSGDSLSFCGYYIESGEETWRAACLLGIPSVPCIVLSAVTEHPGERSLLLRISDNNIHFMDRAELIRHCIKEFGYTQEEIARKTGISQSSVANKLRLLQFLPEERQKIRKLGFSERHARAILRLKTPESRAVAITKIAETSLNVSDTEAMIESLLCAQGKETPSPSAQNPTLLINSAPTSYFPKKFALKSLQPLYNSIENLLTIFRKTGRTAEIAIEEGEKHVEIRITIPQNI